MYTQNEVDILQNTHNLTVILSVYIETFSQEMLTERIS